MYSSEEEIQFGASTCVCMPTMYMPQMARMDCSSPKALLALSLDAVAGLLRCLLLKRLNCVLSWCCFMTFMKSAFFCCDCQVLTHTGLRVVTRSDVQVLERMPEGPARDNLLTTWAILTHLNEQVDKIHIQQQVNLLDEAGQLAHKRLYTSAASVKEREQACGFLAEVLNQLQFSGVPPHELHL